ncbi:PAS domain S-box protein [Solirubrobacter phytolaccae]|uniref:histidine kinase n=1 Tax=Solirubrobacter phytolaccae TaxID=1404360 RepID=A0A9X3SCH0_9ACTN|nr:PAS domain S-box protein [Solirubrobacter phytolaccae]MDA0182525.1 PAS domain S-box protein [Solirubrobacter phytolaccae]
MADVERLGSAPRDVLQALLEAVADAVYLVDPDGRVVFANPAALRLLGYEEEALLGRVSHPTIHHSHWDGSHFPQEQCPMLRPRLTGETVRVYGDCFWRADGSKFRVAYSSAPLAMEEGRGAVVVFRDVTSRMEDEVAARREAVERARAAEIHASRARIVEAADAERRRLGRDLHDGAQQRLVRVLLSLRLASRGTDPGTRELLDAAAGDVDAAIAELRELGAGIHPQILTNRGIAAAVESLTGPLPLLVESSIPETRFAPGVEAAAYFVIAEALTNVLKHARATAALVRVVEADGRLVVEVADDGRGGVDIAGGSGLRGLEDRVAALDGTFEVADGAVGTRVRAVLPL